MDVQICDVIVTVKQPHCEDLMKVVDQLKKAGMQVENLDTDNGVVEGSVNAAKVKSLEKLGCVDYVRTVFTYDAEFPPGDPRDTNNM